MLPGQVPAYDMNGHRVRLDSVPMLLTRGVVACNGCCLLKLQSNQKSNGNSLYRITGAHTSCDDTESFTAYGQASSGGSVLFMLWSSLTLVQRLAGPTFGL